MLYGNYTKTSIEELIQPETPLEKILLREDAVRKGMMWGKPRKGHPEGKVLFHVREVLDNVEEIAATDFMREQLRLITILHDTFKYQEVYTHPRDWSLHHAVIARQFAEQFINDQAVLDVIELHDNAYYCWRALKNGQPLEHADHCINHLFSQLGNNIELYYQFFKCDTQTGDKVQEPLSWFGERVLKQMA